MAFNVVAFGAKVPEPEVVQMPAVAPPPTTPPKPAVLPPALMAWLPPAPAVAASLGLTVNVMLSNAASCEESVMMTV